MRSSPSQTSLFSYFLRFGLMAGLCALLFAGCSVIGGGPPTTSGPVRAELLGETIVVQNERQDTIWTFEAGQRVLARLDWFPSLEQDGLAPGSTRAVALDEIPMEDEEERVVIFWWSARTNMGEREPGDVSSLDVEI